MNHLNDAIHIYIKFSVNYGLSYLFLLCTAPQNLVSPIMKLAAATNLSVELILEIVAFASQPDFRYPEPYATAVALCSVSFAMRRATMPHLLHTVALSDEECINRFINALDMQAKHRARRSRLYVDYRKLTRRFWSETCLETVAQYSCPTIAYEKIYAFMRTVPSLGLTMASLPILYNGMDPSFGCGDPEVDWECTHVSMAGDFWRWRPLTSSSYGQVFLSKITHLVLWISNRFETRQNGIVLPKWLYDVPFEMMKNLMHVAFPISGRSHSQSDRVGRASQLYEILVLEISTPLDVTDHSGSKIKKWLASSNPLAYGTIVPIQVPFKETYDSSICLDWQRAFAEGRADTLWARARQIRRSRDTN